MRHTLYIIACLFLVVETLVGGDQDTSSMKSEHSYAPADGFVPTGEVAVQIAYAVLVPIYGHDTIKREQPLSAKLDGQIWIVTGTMKPGKKGGVALVEIDKLSARILRVTHGK